MATPRAHGEWKQKQQLPARRHDGFGLAGVGVVGLTSCWRRRFGPREWKPSGEL